MRRHSFLLRRFKNRNFTISFHSYRKQVSKNHIDLFIETSTNHLKHYHIKSVTLKKMNITKLCKRKIMQLDWRVGVAHRRRYLFWQGRLSNNRGKIQIIRRGKI